MCLQATRAGYFKLGMGDLQMFVYLLFLFTLPIVIYIYT